MGHSGGILAGLMAATFVAQLDVQSPALEKLSFAALTAALVYWITWRLSKQMDEQTSAIRDLAIAVAKLTELTREHDRKTADQG
jgi:hypothetical protein